MNFEFEQKHIIVIVVVVLVLWMLWSWDSQTKTENFSPVEQFPYLPPKYWEPRKAKKWSPYWFYDSKYKTPKVLSTWNPLWDSEDRYHPAVPQVVRYHPKYKLVPDENGATPVLLPEVPVRTNGQEEPQAEEMEMEAEMLPEEEEAMEETTTEEEMGEEEMGQEEMGQEEMEEIARINAEIEAEKMNSPEMVMQKQTTDLTPVLIVLLIVGLGYWYYTNNRTVV